MIVPRTLANMQWAFIMVALAFAIRNFSTQFKSWK